MVIGIIIAGLALLVACDPIGRFVMDEPSGSFEAVLIGLLIAIAAVAVGFFLMVLIGRLATPKGGSKALKVSTLVFLFLTAGVILAYIILYAIVLNNGTEHQHLERNSYSKWGMTVVTDYVTWNDFGDAAICGILAWFLMGVTVGLYALYAGMGEDFLKRKETETPQKVKKRKKALIISLVSVGAAVLIVAIVLGTLAGIDSNILSKEYEFSKYEDGYCLTKYNGNNTEIEVPETYCKKPVRAISSYCFRRGITKVTIPEGVTTIKDSCFYNCKELSTIVLPASIKEIGKNAFCRELKEVYYAGDATSWCSNISFDGREANPLALGAKLYIDYELVENVVLSEGIQEIKADAFSYYKNIKSITIPDSVTSIGDGAFYNCSGLTSVTIGNGVTNIGKWAFSECTGLTSVTIPDSVTSIGYDAFYKCTGLTSITIPDSVTSIEDGVFRRCSGLTSVTIGNGVTSIGYGAFEECTGLPSIVIPDSVTRIEKFAFAYCSGLTSITIGNGVTSIGYGAFNDCTFLRDVTFMGTKAQWNAINKGESFYTKGTYTVHCTNGDIVE